MKDLSPFIRELLYNHDCVILPGFGGFIGNYTPARIDRDSHTFHPPLKAISFNSRLSHNDGLLIGKISEKKGIGYVDAKRIVDDYISSLKNKLNGGERIHLAGIGHFQMNSEGSVQFEPDNDINFLLDAYGLSTFIREPVEDYDISKAVIRHRDRDPIVIANRRRMIWRAAAAIPFVLAMIVVPLKTDLFKSKVALNPLAEVEFNEIQSAQEELFDEMPETHQAEVIMPATAEKQTEILTETGDAEPVSTVPVESIQSEVITVAAIYHLIVGSFIDADNANRLFNELANKGYNAEILRADNGYYRVSVESFGTMKEADEERKRLNETFKEIWIWKKD
ncbi:MAG: SPOR domain-containing protein [Bacteroidales bacterium]|nr:SPOR domain-containing protein [Bacteroidales bacterium]